MHQPDPMDNLEKSFSELAQFIKSDSSFRSEFSHLKFGKYQIQEILSDKGQAIVYRATDPDLNRQVVLKLPQDEASKQQREQLYEEGRALSALDSPYVVKCIAVEEEDGVPYLILEHVSGTELTDYAKRKQLTRDQIEQIVREIAQGLHAVHRRGLLHLDLKPQNIMVTQSGQVKILDFGLAKPIFQVPAGEIAGTWAFMSPEVANHRVQDIDQRTDLFGLAAIWFFLITGHSPVTALLSETTENESVDFDAITTLCSHPKLLESCLAESPQDRVESVSEFLEQLDGPKKKPVRPTFTIIAGLGCFAVAGYLALVMFGFIDKGVASTDNSDPTPQLAIEETIDQFFSIASENSRTTISSNQLEVRYRIQTEIEVDSSGQITGLGHKVPAINGVHPLELDSLGAIVIDTPSSVHVALISFQYADQKLTTYCVQQANREVVRVIHPNQSECERSIGIRFSSLTPPGRCEYFLILASDTPFDIDQSELLTEAKSVADLERGIESLVSNRPPRLSYFFVPYRVAQ